MSSEHQNLGYMYILGRKLERHSFFGNIRIEVIYAYWFTTS
jgi:hypothetical protein